MAAISRAQLLKELLPGLNALFGTEYNRYEQEHTQIYSEYGSERSFEEDQKITGFGNAPVKTEGASTLFDTAQEGYTTRYIMETISMGFSLTQEAFEDNLYDSLSARYVKELARSMANTKQIKAAAVLNNGFTSFTTGDGSYLYVTTHPLVNGGTISNRPTVAVDFNETSLEAATIQIGKWTDDRGKLINARVRKMIAPIDLQYTAIRVLETQLQPGTANNDVNAIRTSAAVPEGFAINHYLTDPDAWFLLTDVSEGFKYFNRVPISEDSDGDFDTGNMRYKMRERYAFGISDYLATWGSPGA
tara:strand:+ start:328 stop:1236 length:909 start_codon:yes stop_codon:yes gene_type:complete